MNSARRRILGLGGAAMLVGGGVFGARWFNVSAEVAGPGALAVGDAHRQAVAGSILLVDIRRPDEWARTGIGEGAVPIDMRRGDFTDAVRVALSGRDIAVALICARGVRSRKMTQRMGEAGFTRILDVPEGMLGSGAGPGWLRAGLPVVAPS